MSDNATDKRLLIDTEEELNASQCMKNIKISDNRIHIHKKEIAEKEKFEEELAKVNKRKAEETTTFYEEVCKYIRKMQTPSFYEPEKEKQFDKDVNVSEKEKQFDKDINVSKFYNYAYIDKNTWFYMKNNQRNISKETALKLVIALQMTEKSANILLKKISFVLNTLDYRDQIVIAILNARCYNPEQASVVLEWYSQNGKYKFKNIYHI